MGLITTVCPYRGRFNHCWMIWWYPTRQHTYRHTCKLAYHSSITSFSISNLFDYRNYHAQTALQKLVDNHIFLTSAQCKWHSHPNFWGEMAWKRLVWCASRLVGASLLKFLEGLVFVSGMNAHWHECSIETMPTYILYMQTFSITKDLLRALFCKSPCWRSKRSHALFSSPKLPSHWRDESDKCLIYNNSVHMENHRHCNSNIYGWLPWSELPWSFPSSWLARHPQCLCCWCLQLQRSVQGWWGRRQNGLAALTCGHP